MARINLHGLVLSGWMHSHCEIGATNKVCICVADNLLPKQSWQQEQLETLPIVNYTKNTDYVWNVERSGKVSDKRCSRVGVPSKTGKEIRFFTVQLLSTIVCDGVKRTRWTKHTGKVEAWVRMWRKWKTNPQRSQASLGFLGCCRHAREFQQQAVQAYAVLFSSFN